MRDNIDKLYKTKRWKALRLHILNRDFGLCQECKRRKLIRKGNTVHHIVEAREDPKLFWDEDNLETICPSCHNKEHPDRFGKGKKKKRINHVVKFYENAEIQ